jgi:hypothetical protein
MKKLIPILFFLLISSTLIAQPASPVLSEPPDLTSNVSLTPRFEWDVVSGATKYHIEIKEGDILIEADDELEDAFFDVDPTMPLDKGTTYTWKVRAYDPTGWGDWSDIWSFTTTTGDQLLFENNNHPNTYALYQNYPNPFNPVTLIRYDIPKASFVTIVIFDLLGREVTKLVNDKKPAGRYEAEWNGGFVPSGVYIYKIKAGDFVDTKKMVLVK